MTPVASKLPNNCRKSRIVVIIISFQLCILTHVLDLLKGNIMILMFFLVSRSLQWLFLSASFHSQCPRGSLAKGKRCGRAEEVMQELAPENYVKEPNMTLYQLIYFFFLILRFIMLLIFWFFLCLDRYSGFFFVSIFPLGMQAWFAGQRKEAWVRRASNPRIGHRKLAAGAKHDSGPFKV